jgi:hypothetical protein
LKKSDLPPKVTGAACDAEIGSPREEQFWREQELIRHNNNSFIKGCVWTEVERQDAEGKRNKQKNTRRLRIQRDKNIKFKKEMSELKNEKKNIIKYAIEIINPPKNQWRECCREVIYELAEFELARANSLRWNKDNHVAATSIVKALKKARNEAQHLPDFEACQICVPLGEMLDWAEKFAQIPYGKRRTAADKSAAVSSAYRLLSAFGPAPTGTTKNSALYKLAAKFAGGDAGLDHHCRDFFEGVKRHRHEQSLPGPLERANRV